MAASSPGLRLSAAGAATRFSYDRSRVTPGIVHLGVGAFCRAHVAVYVNELLRSDPSWGIIGASLRRPDTRAALAPQDFLYTLVERGRAGTKSRVIGSLLNVLDASVRRGALLSALADPRIRIVSLTITEKGYCHDPASGELASDHPDIRYDLAHPEAPVTTPGLVVQALALRRAAGIKPFTVLSCDNLPANGETTARIVTRFAALRNGDLAGYIAREVAFPSTMVDRIVPATTDDDRRHVLETTGAFDAWPVVTEPFSQWVIEDRFAADRPAFETVGAQLVDDVRPFELMKLRMLNGSHSMLAYLGYLAGYNYVDQAISSSAFRALVRAFITEEVMATLPRGLGDLAAYRDTLLDRFANPALKHRTWQIAMDGSQKLPQRLLGTIRDLLAQGRPITLSALGVAAWMRYAIGVDERGRAIDVQDPLAERMRAIAASAGGRPGRLVEGFLSLSEVFGHDLPRNDAIRKALTRHLTSLLQFGARQTVHAITRRMGSAG